MKVRSKKPVWFLFKLVELIFSLLCCVIHWNCYHHHGVPHVFLLCGSYGGSIIMGLLSILSSFYAEKPKMKYEAAHSGVLGIIHLVTVFAHMYMATLEQFQKPNWVDFFNCTRDNAMFALTATSIYFLHFTFALDLLYSHTLKVKRHPDRCKRPLSLYFISPGVEAYASGFRWYQHLASRMMTSDQTSEHSAGIKHMSYDSESDEEPRPSATKRPDDGRVSGVFQRSNDLGVPSM
ncbi:uncharacterized protein LOC110181129 [Drosophila serrata]|uniref:uncharacterized protein LOC110181129 n=1 Tax=Drosophila serrata TaxID=7274 RepID=UPI000A1D2DED|nr:uncharacterized protein LOC110181129 [Drosophila serrata]